MESNIFLFILSIVFGVIQTAIPVLLLWFMLDRFLRFLMRPLTARWVANGVSITIVSMSLLLVLFMFTGLITRENAETSSVIPLICLSLFLSLNIITMPLLFWIDKERSKYDEDVRIPEVVLHGFAFFGGAIGSYFSQRYFHHKTKKTIFQVVFLLSFVSSVLFYLIAFTLPI